MRVSFSNTGPSWEDYEITETLGEGTFGKVFKVKLKKDLIGKDGVDKLSKKICTNKYYVIKELFTDMMPKKYALRAMEEIQILGEIQSKHIVGYIDSFICGVKVNIVMEYCENGDLEKFLLRNNFSL